MRALLFVLLFTTLCSAQKIHYYKYGYEGIELIGTINDSTIIYSHHLAKPTIRLEVADSVVRRYSKNRMLKGKLVIQTSKAKVFGILTITRTNKLVSLMFTYTKIIWNNGKIEKPK